MGIAVDHGEVFRACWRLLGLLVRVLGLRSLDWQGFLWLCCVFAGFNAAKHLKATLFLSFLRWGTAVWIAPEVSCRFKLLREWRLRFELNLLLRLLNLNRLSKQIRLRHHLLLHLEFPIHFFFLFSMLGSLRLLYWFRWNLRSINVIWTICLEAKHHWPMSIQTDGHLVYFDARSVDEVQWITLVDFKVKVGGNKRCLTVLEEVPLYFFAAFK